MFCLGNLWRVRGGIAPELKTDEMTQPVGVGQDGRLWTKPATGGGGGDVDTKVFPQTVDTSFLNHYTLTVGAGYVPETIDMVFRGNTHSVFHLVRANEEYYTQNGVFVDQNGNTFVVYNGTGDTTKVYIEQETVMVNAGTPVYAVVTAKKIS